MDYGEIVSTSFRLSWKYKSLWLLGLFASGWTFFGFDMLTDLKDKRHFRIEDFAFLDRLHVEETTVIWLATVIGLILLSFIIIHVMLNAICTPALIDAVNRLTRGGVYRLRESVSSGVKFMWRTLALLLLHFLVHLIFWILLVAIVVMFFAIHVLMGVFAILVAIVLGIVFVFVVASVFQLSYRALVARDVGITEALEEGFQLLHHNKMSCLVIFLIYFGLFILTSILATLVLVIMLLPFVLLANLSAGGLIAAVVVGVPVFWFLTLPISGFLGATFESMYTIFYFRLFEPPRTESSTPVQA